jgi:hypothetical protein
MYGDRGGSTGRVALLGARGVRIGSVRWALAHLVGHS